MPLGIREEDTKEAAGVNTPISGCKMAMSPARKTLPVSLSRPRFARAPTSFTSFRLLGCLRHPSRLSSLVVPKKNFQAIPIKLGYH